MGAGRRAAGATRRSRSVEKRARASGYRRSASTGPLSATARICAASSARSASSSTLSSRPSHSSSDARSRSKVTHAALGTGTAEAESARPTIPATPSRPASATSASQSPTLRVRRRKAGASSGQTESRPSRAALMGCDGAARAPVWLRGGPGPWPRSLRTLGRLRPALPHARKRAQGPSVSRYWPAEARSRTAIR